MFFPCVHTFGAYRYHKHLKNNNEQALASFRYQLMFGEFQDTHFVRYVYYWSFFLRRIINAMIILFLQNNVIWQLTLLLLVNLLSLAYTCVSRPYKDTLVNVHTIVNDIGVIAVIGSFYPMNEKFQPDDKFFHYGTITICIIAAIVIVNYALFLFSFLLGILAFTKKCPICSICRRKPKRPKEKVRDEKARDIEYSSEEVE